MVMAYDFLRGLNDNGGRLVVYDAFFLFLAVVFVHINLTLLTSRTVLTRAR